MSGYYRNPEASAAVLREGWLCTGDIGRFDPGGYLYISGRTKDVIVSDAGKNVYPEEVELHYRDLPGVRDLVVLGIPGAGAASGYAPCCFRIPRRQRLRWRRSGPPSAARSEGVRAIDKSPRSRVWRGDLPKTTTLKVETRHARDAVLAGSAATAPRQRPPPAPLGGAGSAKRKTWVIATLAR